MLKANHRSNGGCDHAAHLSGQCRHQLSQAASGGPGGVRVYDPGGLQHQPGRLPDRLRHRGAGVRHPPAALRLVRRTGLQKRDLHQKRDREPESAHQGLSAPGRPCAGLGHGAQRGDAPAGTDGRPRGGVFPHSLPGGRLAVHRADGGLDSPQHPGGDPDPRQQRVRHRDADPAGGRDLPPPGPALFCGCRPDRRSAAPLHDRGLHRRGGLHRPQGAAGAPGHRRAGAGRGAGTGAGPAAQRRHRQPEPHRGDPRLSAGPVRAGHPESAGHSGSAAGAFVAE